MGGDRPSPGMDTRTPATGGDRPSLGMDTRTPGVGREAADTDDRVGEETTKDFSRSCGEKRRQP